MWVLVCRCCYEQWNQTMMKITVRKSLLSSRSVSFQIIQIFYIKRIPIVSTNNIFYERLYWKFFYKINNFLINSTKHTGSFRRYFRMCCIYKQTVSETHPSKEHNKTPSYIVLFRSLNVLNKTHLTIIYIFPRIRSWGYV